MTELLATLASIALVDSLSMVPVAMVPMVMLLASRRPLAGSAAFIAGILLTYIPFGLLLLFGLNSLFDRLAEYFASWWQKEPDLGEVILQILVGLALVVLGHRLCRKRESGEKNAGRPGMGPGQAFMLAAMLNVSGLWGALPYFAAIAQILKEDPSPALGVAALLFYNLVFVLPLLLMVILHQSMGSRADAWLAGMQRFIGRWGHRLVVTLLIGLGFLLVVDGIGWLNGTPLVMAGARD